MIRQIPLSFPVHDSYDAADFMPAECNAQALDWIHRFPDWPSPAVIVYGDRGSGKTHLLHLWAEKAAAEMVASPDIISLSAHRNLAIDDADKIFGNSDAEETLFHLYNMAKENLTYILLSMSNIGALEQIQLPDLKSRLKAAPQVRIDQPDDAALQAVLVKLFHDRQLKVEPGVIAYILPRIERSFQAARGLVETLDKNSLAEKRSVTVPLVRGVIEAIAD